MATSVPGKAAGGRTRSQHFDFPERNERFRPVLETGRPGNSTTGELTELHADQGGGQEVSPREAQVHVSVGLLCHHLKWNCVWTLKRFMCQ